MITINISPLSVNKAWKGKRYKTDDYRAFEFLVSRTLPKELKIPTGRLKITLEWGFSSASSDWDNPIKPFQDILQKKYKFDDKMIFEGSVKKVKTEKGKEYIKFKITQIEQ